MTDEPEGHEICVLDPRYQGTIPETAATATVRRAFFRPVYTRETGVGK